MLSNLLNFISSIKPLSYGLKTDIEKYLEILELPKGHILLKEGQRSDYIYVVIGGLLKMYYLKEGEEVCSRFMEEGHLSLSVKSFYTRTPGYEFIETLEPSTIARIHFDNLEKLYNDHGEFNYIGRVVTQMYFVRSEERLFLIRKHSAGERYVAFMELFPGLLQRVPLTDIASYLGITLETLSRIRKKLSQKPAAKR